MILKVAFRRDSRPGLLPFSYARKRVRVSRHDSIIRAPTGQFKQFGSAGFTAAAGMRGQ
jgi:hypothetical protein